jgi:hypothetical protein
MQASIVFLGWIFVLLASSIEAAAAEKIVRRKSKFDKLAFTEDFETCRKRVLDSWRGKKLDDATVRNEIKKCDDSFPLASYLTKCRQDVLRMKSQDKEAQKQALDACSDRAQSVGVGIKSKFPAAKMSNQVLFAATSFVPKSGQFSAPPNFDCSDVAEAIARGSSGQYLLFGNQLGVFSSFSSTAPRLIARVTKQKAMQDQPGGNKYWHIEHLGRLYEGEKGTEPNLFFPSIGCSYMGKLGPQYETVELHYLLNYRRREAYPYFGIAFLKKDVVIDANDHESLMVEALGSTKISRDKRRSLTIFSKAPLKFDKDGDPKDLCVSPRPHDYIGMIKSAAEKAQNEGYIVVASVKNLCDFGDIMTRMYRSSAGE